MFLRFFQFRSRRAVRRMAVGIGVLLCCLLAVWFLPAIVGSSLIWPRVVAYATPGYPGNITTKRVTLGWFSPVRVRDITIQDADGTTIAQIGSVRTEASLYQLLLKPDQLGVIHIERPRLSVRVRPHGSNVEDALATLLGTRDASGSTQLTIKITDGAMDLSAEATSDHVLLESIQATVALNASPENAGEAAIESCRATVNGKTGTCQAIVAWQTQESSTNWSATAKVDSLPLGLTRLLAQRVGADVQAEGTLSGAADCVWKGDRRQMSVTVRSARIARLKLRAPAWLGPDQLAMHQVDALGTCVVAGNTLRFTRARVECDAGRISIDGRIDLPPSLADASLRQLLASAGSANIEVQGDIDLARLAETLPRTLRIRNDARIETGELQFQWSGRQQADSRQWSARIETVRFSASRDGRRFTWTEPLQLTLEAQQTSDGWNVERLTCHSTFLKLTGRGTKSEGMFSLDCDLDRFVSELQQFVETGPLQVAGRLKSRLNWQRGASGRVSATGTGLIENLVLGTSTNSVWREPRLVADLSIEGDVEGQQLAKIRTARLELSSGDDRLTLQMLEPVVQPGAATVWSVGCELKGQWSSWLDRLGPLLPPHAVRINGPIRAEVAARVAGSSLAIEKASLRCAPFQLASPALAVNERAVVVELEGQCDLATGHWNITEGTFQSSAVAFRVSDVSWRPDHISGGISFRTDLAQVHQSWQFPGDRPEWRMAGTAQGQLSCVLRGGIARARWTVDLVDAEFARRLPPATGNAPATGGPIGVSGVWKTLWKEPIFKVAGSGQYTTASETLVLDRLDISSADELQLSVQGSVAQPTGRCNVDLKGRVTYDLARLLKRVGPDWSRNVQVFGQDTQSFWLRGPLFQASSPRQISVLPVTTTPPHSQPALVPRELSGQGGLRWQAADIFGVDLGPGLIQAELRDGTVHADPITLPVSQGVLTLVPHLNLNGQPPTLTIDPGRLLTDARLSTEMCHGWLKYLAPLAADATQATGQFSLDIDTATIPVATLTAANVRGVMAIQNAEVGPGPLATQLIQIGEQVRQLLMRRASPRLSASPTAWVRIPAQETRFHVVDGRVHHDRLDILAGDVLIRTRGSVGFDQTLSIVAQVPIRDEWIQHEQLLAPLRGQTVEIPIEGTFSNPRIDRRALEKLTTRAFRKAAGQLIENELNKGLQQLFGPGR